MAEGKTCTVCRAFFRLDAFNRDPSKKDGLSSACRACRLYARKTSAKTPTIDEGPETRADARAEVDARLKSNYTALKPEDFDVTVGNDGRIDPHAAKARRQEYSAAMGELAEALHESADPAQVPAHLGTYVGRLAEQERRFGNRRLSRSVSLLAAHEALRLRLFKDAAREHLADKITPTGYAAAPRTREIRRTVVVLLSDLHLGAELDGLDNPVPFGAVQEARRLEKVVREVLDFKPQHREQSELLVLLGGDLIDGMLGHDLRDGAPLVEQKVIFWRYFRDIVGLFAQQFPLVRVECQPGNHGRDRVRHPGRATSSKWDGHEWEMYYALAEMCGALPNVRFSMPFRAVSLVDLYGATLLLTHGDTEIKLGDPDTCASKNAQILDRINSAGIYGRRIDVAAFGHFHKPRYQPRNPRALFNGALVPPNGYARSAGYVGEPCGQWVFEAVEGYPIGDLRFIEVGPAEDRDARLGTLVRPFRFR